MYEKSVSFISVNATKFEKIKVSYVLIGDKRSKSMNRGSLIHFSNICWETIDTLCVTF